MLWMEPAVRIRKPDRAAVFRFLDEQRGRPFSYLEVGATRAVLPNGYTVDTNRIEVGRGEAAWEAARAAIRSWTMFRMSWLELHPSVAPVEAGACVAVVTRRLGLWWLNASRIVYVVDQPGPVRRFGFAYGTLPGHAESGEERFSVEFREADESVWYDLLAFSRPNYAAVRWARPLARRLQKRFAADSLRAMRSAVSEAAGRAPRQSRINGDEIAPSPGGRG